MSKSPKNLHVGYALVLLQKELPTKAFGNHETILKRQDIARNGKPWWKLHSTKFRKWGEAAVEKNAEEGRCLQTEEKEQQIHWDDEELEDWDGKGLAGVKMNLSVNNYLIVYNHLNLI